MAIFSEEYDKFFQNTLENWIIAYVKLFLGDLTIFYFPRQSPWLKSSMLVFSIEIWWRRNLSGVQFACAGDMTDKNC